MPRLCIFNSMSKIDDMGRVLMSRVWDLLIHCFGTRLANMWENFDVGSKKISQQFSFYVCVMIDLSWSITGAVFHYVFIVEVVFSFHLVLMVLIQICANLVCKSPNFQAQSHMKNLDTQLNIKFYILYDMEIRFHVDVLFCLLECLGKKVIYA